MREASGSRAAQVYWCVSQRLSHLLDEVASSHLTQMFLSGEDFRCLESFLDLAVGHFWYLVAFWGW